MEMLGLCGETEVGVELLVHLDAGEVVLNAERLCSGADSEVITLSNTNIPAVVWIWSGFSEQSVDQQ